MDEITFEKNVIIADLGYRDFPYLEILWLDNNHRSEVRTSRARWSDLGVPQCSHGAFRHVGDDVRSGRTEKVKRERKDGAFATRLSPFYTGITFKKSTNLVRFGMPVVRYMTSLRETTPEFLFGQVATLIGWYHVVDWLSAKLH